jgi:APA family basic amino acid/polyamine antiporter
MRVSIKTRLFRRKMIKDTLGELMPHQHLVRCLSAFDLTLLGIGAIIGAGIFILTGVAAATQAGPAIILSFVLASMACLFSALSYAELAAAIGGCGGAYGYAFAGFGEVFAWIIGWDLILEYGISVSAVAIGWSSYSLDILQVLGVTLPEHLVKAPYQGGWINLPAMLIVLALTGLLALGVKASVRFNTIIVFVKLATIALFIAIASRHVEWSHWNNFLPFGWNGIVSGASLIFFAYIGFDAVSTAAEEAKDPQRDMPRGIIASLIVCTVCYIIVSGLLTLVVPYATLNTASPVANVLLTLGYNVASSLIAIGALAGLTTVMLVMFYGLSRVMLAMSRDKLLPASIAHVSSRTKTPTRIILLVGSLVSLVAAFLPIGLITEMVNIGTLAAFLLVNLGTITMRYSHPELERPFKVPGGYLLPALGIFFCLYLMFYLPWVTWLRFLGWMLIGALIYWHQLVRTTKKA